MGYFKRNIVPGHWRTLKNGKQIRNPGYDINPMVVTGSRRWLQVRGYVVDSWYKPKRALTKRGNKRGQSKPR